MPPESSDLRGPGCLPALIHPLCPCYPQLVQSGPKRAGATTACFVGWGTQQCWYTQDRESGPPGFECQLATYQGLPFQLDANLHQLGAWGSLPFLPQDVKGIVRHKVQGEKNEGLGVEFL